MKFSLFAPLLAVAGATTIKETCSAGQELCVTAVLVSDSTSPTSSIIGSAPVANNTSIMVFFTVHSSLPGWAAIGFGSLQMAGSTMVAGWKDRNDSVIITTLDGKGHALPQVSSNQIAQVASAPAFYRASTPPWAKLSLTFAIPASSIPSSNSDFIWAIGSTAPSLPSQLSIHAQKGSFANADFVNTNASLSLFASVAALSFSLLSLLMVSI